MWMKFLYLHSKDLQNIIFRSIDETGDVFREITSLLKFNDENSFLLNLTQSYLINELANHRF